MIEVLFLISEFQCGSSAPQAQFEIVVEVDGQNHYFTEGQRKLIPGVDSIDDVDNVTYNVLADGSCADENIYRVVEYGDDLPQLSAAYNQESLEEIETNYLTNEYMELYLMELGTDNTSSSVYDLQDIVLVVDTNPYIYPAD